MFRFVKNNWGLLLVLLFSLFPLLPLFHTGFFPMHDDTQVARVFEMGKSLHDGMIPVRWVQDLGYGYGYPIFTFYAPLAFYIGGFMTIFGAQALTATKIMMGIAVLLSGIFMYYFARSVWGELGGILSAIAYVYAPYHALDIYVRGDVAEFWAYAFIPLAFLGLWELYQTQKIRYVLFGAVGVAGIILSHNLTALMVMPFLFLFGTLLIFLSKQKSQSIFYFLSFILIGLLLSAFYWLPVPFEMGFTNVISQVKGGADFHTNFVCLSQLWNSPWGYGGSIPGCIDGISFALGKIFILFFVAGTFLIPYVLKKDKIRGYVVILSIACVFSGIFLLLQVSQPIWDSLHFMAFLQYPWRFLTIIFFFISFIAGSLFWVLEQSALPMKKIISLGLFAVFAVILLVVQGKYFRPQTYYAVNSSFYTNPLALEWKTSRITDEYMPKNFNKPKNVKGIVRSRFILAKANGSILQTTEQTQKKTARVQMTKAGVLFITLAYFPGWSATVDGVHTVLSQEANGMLLNIPKGVHTVSVAYNDTLVEKVGDGITLVGMIIVILVIIRAYRKKKL